MSTTNLAAAIENLSQAVQIQQTGFINVPRWTIVEMLEVFQSLQSLQNVVSRTRS
jgi:hypothetical protein